VVGAGGPEPLTGGAGQLLLDEVAIGSAIGAAVIAAVALLTYRQRERN
jgi:hypothetical protein